MSWPVEFEGAAEPPPRAEFKKFGKRDTWPVGFEGAAELPPKAKLDKFKNTTKATGFVWACKRGVERRGVLRVSWPVGFEGAAEPPPRAELDKFDKQDEGDKGDRPCVGLQARGVAPGCPERVVARRVRGLPSRPAKQNSTNSTNSTKATKATAFVRACRRGV